MAEKAVTFESITNSRKKVHELAVSQLS